MKKTLLALAVVSVATIASAEVKLSGDVTVGFGQNNIDVSGTDFTNVQDGDEIVDPRDNDDVWVVGGEDSKFSDQGTELNIDAEEVINGNLTGYAHLEISNGDEQFDEQRVGLKGSWGDVQLGDVASACDDLMVGGTNEIVVATHDLAGCGDGNGSYGLKYSGKFGPASVAISHRPGEDDMSADETSIAASGNFASTDVALAYTTASLGDYDVNTTQFGAQTSISGFTVGAQVSSTDADNSEVMGWELNAAYALPSGLVYAGYGSADTDLLDNDGNTVDTVTESGFSVGYTHNLSSRTAAWVEYGAGEISVEGANGSVDLDSVSTGLKHSF